jgi:hypothetical protein
VLTGHKKKETGKVKKDLTIFSALVLLALMLTLASCVRSTGVPCEALTLIYYDDIQPEQAEINVLLNNAVIEELCQ